MSATLAHLTHNFVAEIVYTAGQIDGLTLEGRDIRGRLLESRKILAGAQQLPARRSDVSLHLALSGRCKYVKFKPISNNKQLILIVIYQKFIETFFIIPTFPIVRNFSIVSAVSLFKPQP
jgi:hypothetical protein